MRHKNSNDTFVSYRSIRIFRDILNKFFELLTNLREVQYNIEIQYIEMLIFDVVCSM